MKNSVILFSFKKNEYIEIENFVIENNSFNFVFKNDTFYIEFNDVKMYRKYDTCFYLENNIYFITKKKGDSFFIEDKDKNNFFIEYNFFSYCRIFLRFLKFIDIRMIFLAYKNFIFLNFLLILLYFTYFCEKYSVKNNEFDFNIQYVKEYLLEKSLLKIIFNEVKG
nr:hypothetical protein GTC16762_15010 [Pigmentibacter ruber]